jgi:putative holliday junction resolvase
MKIRQNPKPENVLLAIDHGGSNIGLAFGRDGFVSPIGVVSNANEHEAIKEISKIALENRVNKIIIGIPRTADGKETKQSLQVRKFTKLLKGHLKIQTDFVDEYATSKEAVRASIEMGISQKNRKSVDDISAALILKRYFEEHPISQQSS